MLVVPIIFVIVLLAGYFICNLWETSHGRPPIPFITKEDLDKLEHQTQRSNNEIYEVAREARKQKEEQQPITEADIRNFVNRVESAGYNVDFLKKK